MHTRLALSNRPRPSPKPARILPAVAGLTMLLLAAACASPARQFSDRAAALGLHPDVVEGNGFHVAVFRQAGRPSRTLHVYIDGDGTPWRFGRPATDPTPRTPLALDLMARDPNPSVYLGRPCYHGLSETPPCTSALWTWDRYSETVVAAMAAALRQILGRDHFERVAWFGYSGGGTLAMLLAPRFAETASVTTVAANLDIDAWADLHGYPRLTGSLSPARQPRMPPHISQRHYVGGEDQVVPEAIVARGPIDPATLIVIPSYDHTCCWTTLWPTIVAHSERATQPADR
jgi:dienelactone hydrolase